MDYFDYFNTLNKDESHFTSSNDICTPMECVKEMVDCIPQEFWSTNPKILDPCCGNGNFGAYIQTKFNDQTKALKENLYFNEINPIRIQNLKSYFGNDINLTQIDFLEYPLYNKYDLIVANPPFALITNGKRSAKNHNVSRLFINTSLELLNNNGYLLYIIPDNFMSLSDANDTFSLLSKYDILHINIHGAKRYFKGVGSSFVYILVKKSHNNIKTLIENNYCIKDTQTAIIEHSDYLPLYYSELVRGIFNKTINADNEKFKVETSSDLHATTQKKLLSNIQDEQHPYRIKHTFNTEMYSERPHKYQEGWKCFICLTSYYDICIDDCGMTQSVAFIKCNSKGEAELTYKTLIHPLYRFLNNLCRYGNFNNIRILQKFPKCYEDPYNKFGITEEEKRLIESII